MRAASAWAVAAVAESGRCVEGGGGCEGAKGGVDRVVLGIACGVAARAREGVRALLRVRQKQWRVRR